MNEQQTKKIQYKRIREIPIDFPLQHYSLNCFGYSPARLLVGMDSGISHCAFSEIEMVRENQRYVDFKILNTYYFEEEILKYRYTDDKIFFLAEKYWTLFSQKNICCTCFEHLPLNSIKDDATLRGVLQAQKTTDIIAFLSRILGHPYQPYSPTEVKRTCTGNGNATKEEVQQAMFKLTDLQWPILLENNHIADSCAVAFVKFIDFVKEDHILYKSPIPPKFQNMTWINWNEFPYRGAKKKSKRN